MSIEEEGAQPAENDGAPTTYAVPETTSSTGLRQPQQMAVGSNLKEKIIKIKFEEKQFTEYLRNNNY
jgi:hypothetical protein